MQTWKSLEHVPERTLMLSALPTRVHRECREKNPKFKDVKDVKWQEKKRILSKFSLESYKNFFSVRISIIFTFELMLIITLNVSWMSSTWEVVRLSNYVSSFRMWHALTKLFSTLFWLHRTMKTSSLYI